MDEKVKGVEVEETLELYKKGLDAQSISEDIKEVSSFNHELFKAKVRLDDNDAPYFDVLFKDGTKKRQGIIRVLNKPNRVYYPKYIQNDFEKLKEDVLYEVAKKNRHTATELLVDSFKDTNYIYTIRNDEKTEVWIYKEGVYVPEGKTYIQEFCRDVLKDCYTSHMRNVVIEKIESDTFINQDDFFNNEHPDLVPVQNGILNVITKELKPFDPKIIFFNKLPTFYDKTKECPHIINHLKTVLKNEADLPVMQELFGFLLYKDYKYEKAFMMTGGGRNGKGKTVELMKRFIGADNCCNVTLQQIEKDPFALVNFHGKMANLGADISSTGLKETGNFKSLTGHDLISANRKNKTYLNFVNYAKMVFCANEIPYSSDTTTAFFNRWILLEFPYTFVSEKEYSLLDPQDIEKNKIKKADPQQIEHLTKSDELSGLLNWALAGLERLFNSKGFSYSNSTDEVKNIWLRKTDSLTAFVEQKCDLGYEKIIPKQVFKESYENYCKNHKVKCFTDKTIKQKLKDSFDVEDERRSFFNKQERCWVGLNLK